MQRNKPNQKYINTSTQKNIKAFSISLAVSLILFVSLSLVLSLILLKSPNPVNSYIMYFYGLSSIPAFIGGFISSKSSTLKGIISGLISGVIYLLVITLVLLIVSKFHIRADILIYYLIEVIFACIGGISGANTKRRK